MSSKPPHGPPGVDPNFNNAPKLLGAAWSLAALVTVFVGLRLYTRAVLVKNVALDDHILILAVIVTWATAALAQVSCNAGLGRPLYFLPPENVVEALKWVLIAQPVGILAGMLGRISFAVTLLRLPGPHDQVKRATLYGIIVEQVLVNFTFVIIQFAQCGSQVNAIWDPAVAAKAHCWSRNVEYDFGIFQSSTSVATDLALTVVPLWIIWKMQLKLAVKISLGFLLGLSIFAMITTIVKTVEVSKVQNNPDVTVATATLFMWGELEGAMVIIAASISAFKPLFQKIAPHIVTGSAAKIYKLSSHRNDRSNPGNQVMAPVRRRRDDWDFEMLPMNSALHQEKTLSEDPTTHHTSWYSDVDETIIRAPGWEDEERRVQTSLEHSPAPELLPKESLQSNEEALSSHYHTREPKNIV
ncbi:hypothetical protein EV356DRAFT_258530 [Viridothelium virens]|uniref:Rhodopsin domain-containing protein n=1 Tax=Viridothelium virens TaxID=1048519 RepID=A0A6A6H2T6_VIRVR|nr:hypothetical protein EV356DRAFT_258530 [Viridothelium virens]